VEWSSQIHLFRQMVQRNDKYAVQNKIQVGSLAGAAQLLKNNAVAQNETHYELKSYVECQGKCLN